MTVAGLRVHPQPFFPGHRVPEREFDLAVQRQAARVPRDQRQAGVELGVVQGAQQQVDIGAGAEIAVAGQGLHRERAEHAAVDAGGAQCDA
jgi:hypothetical protein